MQFQNVAPEPTGGEAPGRPVTLLGRIEVSTLGLPGITHILISPGGTAFLLRPFPDQIPDLNRRAVSGTTTLITGTTESARQQGLEVVVPNTVESPSAFLPGVPGLGVGLAGAPLGLLGAQQLLGLQGLAGLQPFPGFQGLGGLRAFPLPQAFPGGLGLLGAAGGLGFGSPFGIA